MEFWNDETINMLIMGCFIDGCCYIAERTWTQCLRRMTRTGIECSLYFSKLQNVFLQIAKFIVQRGCGRVVWDARQGQGWNALLGRILGRGNQKRESLQADGRRSQRQDFKECKFINFGNKSNLICIFKVFLEHKKHTKQFFSWWHFHNISIKMWIKEIVWNSFPIFLFWWHSYGEYLMVIIATCLYPLKIFHHIKMFDHLITFFNMVNIWW